jgi:hypothetical protein
MVLPHICVTLSYPVVDSAYPNALAAIFTKVANLLLVVRTKSTYDGKDHFGKYMQVVIAM